MKASVAAVELIARFEGFRSAPYVCPAGLSTIGYGSTRYADGRRVTMLDRHITEPEARALLLATLAPYEKAVDAAVRVPLTQSQFDALVSLAYNVGTGAFSGSTLVRMLNAHDYLGAADQFMRWTRGGGKVLPGLIKRREAERALFLSAT